MRRVPRYHNLEEKRQRLLSLPSSSSFWLVLSVVSKMTSLSLLLPHSPASFTCLPCVFSFRRNFGCLVSFVTSSERKSVVSLMSFWRLQLEISFPSFSLFTALLASFPSKSVIKEAGSKVSLSSNWFPIQFLKKKCGEEDRKEGSKELIFICKSKSWAGTASFSWNAMPLDFLLSLFPSLSLLCGLLSLERRNQVKRQEMKTRRLFSC